MSDVTPLYSYWQLAADASDRVGELIDEIPGWDGYEYADETQQDLQRTAALLQQVIPLLERASRREAKLWTDAKAVGG
jgi:hypothetical protein